MKMGEVTLDVPSGKRYVLGQTRFAMPKRQETGASQLYCGFCERLTPHRWGMRRKDGTVYPKPVCQECRGNATAAPYEMPDLVWED